MTARKNGFTLAELMVVIVIIGALSAVAIPNFITMRHRAQEAKLQTAMNDFQDGVELYISANQGEIPKEVDLVEIYLPNGHQTNPFTHQPMKYNAESAGNLVYTTTDTSYTITVYDGENQPKVWVVNKYPYATWHGAGSL